jgi:hypothetical protein
MKTRIRVALAALAVVVVACSSSTAPEQADVSAVLEVTPSAGTAVTDFTFDASGSSSRERALEYRWDWDGDGAWDTGWSSEATVTRRFTSGDTIRTTVEVRDGSRTDTALATIVLDDRHGEILERIPFPYHRTAKDLTHDGTHLWVTTWEGNTIKIDPATGDSVGAIPGNSAWTGGTAWDGEYIWTTGWQGSMKAFKQDPLNGDVLETFNVTYSGDCGGLDWDGEAFYQGSDEASGQGDGSIHKYAPDGTHLLSLPSPRGSIDPRGLAYDGRDLWVAIQDRDTLYVVDPADGTVLRTVPHLDGGANGNSRGIVVVGDYLWAVLNTLPDPPELGRIVP